MKRIVIIGGGFAGSYCARHLEKDFDVTLIDTKDYFEFTPSILRTIVEPKHAKHIQVLHSSYLHRAQLIHGEVSGISESHVTVKSKYVPYDYLIIASGSTYNRPIKEKNVVITTRANVLRKHAQELKGARRVLIAGGGLVGVELAAEIITAYPKKEVTLVHSRSELIERNPKKARDYAEQFLKKRKVELIFNERVEKRAKGYAITDKGRKIKTDLTFLCTGIMPNYAYLAKSCSTSLDKHNLCVNAHLQVHGYANIFAAGDIAGIAEEKTAQNAEMQAEVVVGNIRLIEKKEPLKTYRSSPRIMAISLGKWDGMVIYKGKVFTGILAGILKNAIEWKAMRSYR